MELAIGMLALAIVTSALTVFAVYIVTSLRVQNSLRGPAPQPNVRIKLDDFAMRHFGGEDAIKMDERAVMPSLEVAK